MVGIYYSTVYGSTREYAEELASLLDDSAQPIPSSPPQVDGPVVVLSPIHGCAPDRPRGLCGAGTGGGMGSSSSKRLEVHDLDVAALLGEVIGGHGTVADVGVGF